MNEIAGRNPKQPGELQEPTVAEHPLVLSMIECIGFGAFSVVFRHPNNGKVFKLFRKRDENNKLQDLGDHEPALRRAAFDSEVAAYRIAMSSAAICPLVPKFHGEVVVEKVLTKDGTDISCQFLLDCCYVIDFIEGAEHEKFTHTLAAQHIHLREAIHAFESNGIKHWNDGTVFHPTNQALTKIIDFALADVYGNRAAAIACAE